MTWRVRLGRRILAWLLCVGLVGAMIQVSTPVAALPEGGAVTHGDGAMTYAPDGTNLTVTQESDRLIIDWSTFGIGSGESVTFEQRPDQIALNRVTGTEPSEIVGQLTAGGQVFLVNPRGIVIGNGAVVDVGGLVASTLEITNEEFLGAAGAYTFAGGDAAGLRVDAGAALTASPGGYLVLLAPRLDNAGSLEAPGGRIGLGAGVEATLYVDGASFGLVIDEAAVEALIHHSGTIVADGGVIVLAARAGDPASLVVNHAGLLRARTVEERDGRIILSAGSGKIDAGDGTTEASRFDLVSGTWEQKAEELPLFEAGDFRVAEGAGFLRVTGGDGTEESRYRIADVYGLQGMGSTGMLGWHYELGGDIDATGTAGWNDGQGFSPVGNSTNRFTGSFDGQGHVIAGLVIDRPAQDYVGLFGYASGILRNVGLQGGSVSGRSRVGSLAGAATTIISDVFSTLDVSGGDDSTYVGGLVGEVTTRIDVNNAYTTGTVTAGDRAEYVGGLLGYAGGYANSGFRIRNAYTTGAVTVGNNAKYVAGLVGYAGGYTGMIYSIDDSYTTGAVTAGDHAQFVGGLAGFVTQRGLKNVYALGDVTVGAGGSSVGGLVGAITSASGSNVSNAYATGEVRAGDNSTTIGGLIGESGLPIVYSYATGHVTAGSNSNTIGGLVGGLAAALNYSFAMGNVSGGPGSSKVGGLVGDGRSSISDSYATGDVSGTQYVGGLVGSLSSSLARTYATGSVTATADAGGLVGSSQGAVAPANYYAVTDRDGKTINNGGSTSLVFTGNQNGSPRSWELLSSLTTYTSWAPAFGLHWTIYPGQTTPLLQYYMTPLVVKVKSLETVYDGAVPTGFTYEIDGEYDERAILGEAVFLGAGADAGSYTVTLSGLYSHQFGYVLEFQSGTLVVKPRVISLHGNRAYDGTTELAAGIFALENLVGGESLILAGAGTMGDIDAGAGKAVTLGTLKLLDGAGDGAGRASNYTLDGGTHTVDIAKVQVTVRGITASDKMYDGTTAATIDYSGASLSGVVSGDELFVAGATGAFEDKAAGDGKTVTITGIVLGGSGAKNYELADDPVTATASISKAKITHISGITAADKPYDGTASASLDLSAAILTGKVSGDDLVVAKAVGTFESKDAGEERTVSITGLVLDGDDASNYELALERGVSTTAAITPRVVRLVGNRVYDGTTELAASIFDLEGVLEGESLSLTGVGSMTDKKAGTGKNVILDSLALADGDGGDGNGAGLASNYTLDGGAHTVDIAKATVQLTGVQAAPKTYDGSRTATIDSYGQLSGVLPDDDVELDTRGAEALFHDAGPGEGKLVTVTGLALRGEDADNYIFDGMATAAADIVAGPGPSVPPPGAFDPPVGGVGLPGTPGGFQGDPGNESGTTGVSLGGAQDVTQGGPAEAAVDAPTEPVAGAPSEASASAPGDTATDDAGRGAGVGGDDRPPHLAVSVSNGAYVIEVVRGENGISGGVPTATRRETEGAVTESYLPVYRRTAAGVTAAGGVNVTREASRIHVMPAAFEGEASPAIDESAPGSATAPVSTTDGASFDLTVAVTSGGVLLIQVTAGAGMASGDGETVLILTALVLAEVELGIDIGTLVSIVVEAA